MTIAELRVLIFDLDHHPALPSASLPHQTAREQSAFLPDEAGACRTFLLNWQSLADQARSLEPDHRTLARETIPVAAPSRSVGVSPTDPLEPQTDAAAELARLIDSLRRAIRLKDYAVATEETHLLESGTDIRTVQSLMSHTSVETTMIYLHVIKRPGAGGLSPLDLP